MMRFPRWLSWVVLIGLGWILYVGNTSERAVPPALPATSPASTAAEPAAPKQYKEIQALLDSQRWMKAIYPDYKNPDDACRATEPAEGRLGNFAMILNDGSGSAIECTQSTTFGIARYDNQGKLGAAKEYTASPAELVGLGPLLSGMREGEQRVLLVTLQQSKEKSPLALPAGVALTLLVTRR